jgi:para-aminobenzoate synthetase component 1
MKNGIIQTRPIKGTRKRGSTPSEDIILKRELENSVKDKSELLMITDLERNDLNRICKSGSVNVTELFTVESYNTVHHLISNIIGEIQTGLNAMDLINATFPGGSITGAPKMRAMEIINKLEHSNRNIYTGSLGYLSLDGSCDLNIIIRSALYKDGTYYIGCGGGITYESDANFEYEESLQKAYALLETLGIRCR